MAKASEPQDWVDLHGSAGPPAPERTIREVCHDLRQPIATISALAEAAGTHPDLPETVRQRLAQILAEARLMSEIARGLLEQTPNLAPVDAGKVATEVVTSARVTFPGTLQVVAETSATVVADQVVLRRALTNLVENATRAAGPEGTVMVSVRRAGGWVSCEVSDSGPGFGAGPPGAGSLGLSIVERFVRTHHGRLDVSRGALGGALVRLRLPDPRRRLLSRAQSGIRGKVLH